MLQPQAPVDIPPRKHVLEEQETLVNRRYSARRVITAYRLSDPNFMFASSLFDLESRHDVESSMLGESVVYLDSPVAVSGS